MFRAGILMPTVPAGHVHVLGDSRPNGTDSQVFGPVPIDVWRIRIRREVSMTARFASRCLACLATVAWGLAPGAVAQDVSTPTSGDVLTDLGTLGGRVSSATAIDKAGQIAGSAETSEILGPHYERPVAVKRRYDPTNLFRQN